MANDAVALIESLRRPKAEAVQLATDRLRADAVAHPGAYREPSAVAALVETFDYPQSYDARATAILLADDVCATEVAEHMAADLASPNTKTRAAAMQRLTHVAQFMPQRLVSALKRRATPALVAALDDVSWATRASAARVLGSFKIASAIPSLVARLDDPNDYVRGDAAMALGRFGKRAEAAVPTLATLLSDTANQCFAAEALGLIGAAALPVVPLIERAATLAREEGDDEMPDAAEAAVRRIKRAAARAAKRSAEC